MKEYDIYLNDRLTECDIIIRQLPYRSFLSAEHKLVIQSCLDACLLYKFIAVQTGSELIAHVDRMIKTCCERLDIGLSLHSAADFSKTAFPSLSLAPVVIGLQPAALTAVSFIETANALLLGFDPVTASLKKPIEADAAAIQLDQAVIGTLKTAVEQVQADFAVDAKLVGTHKQSYTQAGSELLPQAEVLNLCYLAQTAGDTGLAVAASILETELHYPLGRGETDMAIGVSVGRPITLEKYETAVSVVGLISELALSALRSLEPDGSAVVFAIEAAGIIRRYRLLWEVDEESLDSIDEMPLDELGYVTLEA